MAETVALDPNQPAGAFRVTQRYIWGLDLAGSWEHGMQMNGPQGSSTRTGGVGALLGVITESGKTYSVCNDANGNVMGFIDLDTATLTARFDYDAFGNQITNWTAPDHPAPETITRIRFSSKPQCPHTGWVYYGYRWYDPENGRWPSRDPIGERGGVNLYGMVGNDAINYTDRLGLDRVTPIEDSLAVKVQVGDCEIVIIEGHGAKNIINQFDPPADPRCGFFMGQDTCESNHTNSTIPGNRVIPGLPDNPDARPNAPSRVNDDAEKNKQTEQGIAKATAELCKCCKEVNLVRIYIDKNGWGSKRGYIEDWFQLPPRMLERKIPCSK